MSIAISLSALSEGLILATAVLSLAFLVVWFPTRSGGRWRKMEHLLLYLGLSACVCFLLTLVFLISDVVQDTP